MRAFPITLALFSAVGLASGCTSLKATIHMADAEKALRVADEYDAKNLATYEYIMAMRYLQKAKEEISYNEHRMAEDLAKKSQEWSDKAIIFIQRGGRLDLSEEDFDFLRDKSPDEAPPEAPLEDVLIDGTDETPPPEPKPEDDFDFDEEEDFEMETP